MASNFQFFSHRTKNSLHLKLYGDFDETSARQLLHALTNHSDGAHQIFIDTNDLRTVHAHGQEIFQKNMDMLNRHSINLTFIGKNKHRISKYAHLH